MFIAHTQFFDCCFSILDIIRYCWWLLVTQKEISVCNRILNSHKSESRLVVSDYLWTYGLYSPWNSPGQNTGVGSLSLLQGIFPTQELNQGLLKNPAGRFFTNWAFREAGSTIKQSARKRAVSGCFNMLPLTNALWWLVLIYVNLISGYLIKC